MPKDAQIDASEIFGKTQAFVAAHESCPLEMVEAHRGEWSLVLWCRWCSCLETYRFGVLSMDRALSDRSDARR